MNCREICDGLSDYLDDELARKKCREIEAHLATCYNCQVIVDTMRKTIALYHAIPNPSMPEEVRLRLHKVIRLDK